MSGVVQTQPKICTLSPFKKVRRGDGGNVCSPEQKKEGTVFQVWYENQRKWMKGVPIPHLAKESTGAEALLLSKPTVSIKQKQGRGTGRAERNKQGGGKSQRTGSNYRRTKSAAVISASNQSAITNKHKQPGQTAALITGLIVAR